MGGGRVDREDLGARLGPVEAVGALLLPCRRPARPRCRRGWACRAGGSRSWGAILFGGGASPVGAQGPRALRQGSRAAVEPALAVAPTLGCSGGPPPRPVSMPSATVSRPRPPARPASAWASRMLFWSPSPDAGREGHVELQPGDGQVAQVADRGVAGAEVVDVPARAEARRSTVHGRRRPGRSPRGGRSPSPRGAAATVRTSDSRTARSMSWAYPGRVRVTVDRLTATRQRRPGSRASVCQGRGAAWSCRCPR